MIDGRPLPLLEDSTRPYWEACARGELCVQRCTDCGKLQFPPRPMCPACQSLESEMAPMSGRGTIYSFVIVHPPVLPAFRDKLPLPVVLVELDEGATLRIIGNLVGDAEPTIGAKVAVTFEKIADDVTLPQWRLVDP